MTFDTHELAWAAGFFDGEGHSGSIGWTPTRTRSLRMVVVQHGRATLDRFRDAVQVGKVRGPYLSNPSRRRIRFVWAAQSVDDVQITALVLWPWLSQEKREQLDAAIATYNEHHGRHRTRVPAFNRWGQPRKRDERGRYA